MTRSVNLSKSIWTAVVVLGLLLLGCESSLHSGTLLKHSSIIWGPKCVHQKQDVTVTRIFFAPAGHPYILAKLNGMGPYPFIVDTGSNVSIIPIHLAKKLALNKAMGRARVVPDSYHTQASVSTYRVDQLKIRDATLKDIQFGVLPDSEFKEISEHAGMEIAGLLGFNLFHDFLLTLNFPEKKMILQKGQLAKLGNPYVITMNTDSFKPIVHGRFGTLLERPNHAYSFLIDTGASSSIHMPPNISTLPFNKIQSFKIQDQHLHRHAHLKVEQLDTEFSLAHLQIQKPLVYFQKPALYPNTQYGVIGMEVLKELAVTFDQKNHYILLEDKRKV